MGAPKVAADVQCAAALVVSAGSVGGDGDSIAVDDALVGGSVIGAGPVMPAGIRIPNRGVQIVVPESTGEDIGIAKRDVQTQIGTACPLGDDMLVGAVDQLPLAPKGDREGAVGQVDAADSNLVSHPVQIKGQAAEGEGDRDGSGEGRVAVQGGGMAVAAFVAARVGAIIEGPVAQGRVGAILHLIDKRICAVEILGWGVGERTVCSERNHAIDGAVRQRGRQRVALRVAVIVQHARGSDNQRRVFGSRVDIVYG